MNNNNFNGSNINFSYDVMEIAHILINTRLSASGVDKFTMSKCYVIVELEDGCHIFINNYYDYDDIYNQIESKFSDPCLMHDEIISEILKFLNDESKTIKKIIKNFRSWNR